MNDELHAGGHGRLEVAIRRKTFHAASGEEIEVLQNLHLALDCGEVGAVVGPSGCGKTTLLRILAGLDRQFDGEVTLPRPCKLGMVFQEPRLLPWRTVEDNVRLAAPEASSDLICQLFVALGLDGHRTHYPFELSLGLARRVALARAFAVVPDVLLLDEPFVSLDAALAGQLRGALSTLVARRPLTVLLVTHDVEEAIALADRVFLLSPRPARLAAELALEHPRSPRTPDEIATILGHIQARTRAAIS